MLEGHVEQRGVGVVLRHDLVASHVTIDRAVTAALQELHPRLYESGPSAFSYSSSSEPFLIVVEDVNRSGQAARLIERIAGWNRAGSAGDREPPWRLVCPVWPQTVGGHNYRTRSIGHVIEEVKYVMREMPEVKEIFFDDDTLTDNRPRVEELARELGKLGVTWSCNAKANVPYETLKIMREGGLRLDSCHP